MCRWAVRAYRGVCGGEVRGDVSRKSRMVASAGAIAAIRTTTGFPVRLSAGCIARATLWAATRHPAERSVRPRAAVRLRVDGHRNRRLHIRHRVSALPMPHRLRMERCRPGCRPAKRSHPARSRGIPTRRGHLHNRPIRARRYSQPGYGTVPTAPISRKRRSPWPIIGAVGALIGFGVIAVVVWYARLSPSVSKIEFAHNFQDNKVVDVTDTFKSSDPIFYAVIHLSSAKANPSVKIIWTIVDATDSTTKNRVTGQTFGEAELITTIPLLYGSVPRRATPWPVGQYKADVFLDGKLAQTAQFMVTA